MEFHAMQEFFASLKYAKRKYPSIVTYNTYLKKIGNQQYEQEVNLFKKFLIANQSISEKQFDNEYFKTGKSILAMNNFTHGPNFWDDLLKVEQVLFPDGKPEKPTEEASGLTGAMAAFENNDIMSEIVNQVKSIENLDQITDINALIATEGFQKMVTTIKNKIQNGQYSIKELTGMVSNVIGSVQDDVDDETKTTLKVVTDTMGAVERDEPVDIEKLVSIVGNFKM